MLTKTCWNKLSTSLRSFSLTNQTMSNRFSTLFFYVTHYCPNSKPSFSPSRTTQAKTTSIIHTIGLSSRSKTFQASSRRCRFQSAQKTSSIYLLHFNVPYQFISYLFTYKPIMLQPLEKINQFLNAMEWKLLIIQKFKMSAGHYILFWHL